MSNKTGNKPRPTGGRFAIVRDDLELYPDEPRAAVAEIRALSEKSETKGLSKFLALSLPPCNAMGLEDENQRACVALRNWALTT